MAEMKEILAALDDSEVDLDQVAQLVERASVLLRYCHEKLVKTELRVREVLAEVDAEVASLEG